MKKLANTLAALFTVLLVVAGAMAFTACDDGEDEEETFPEVTYVTGIATPSSFSVSPTTDSIKISCDTSLISNAYVDGCSSVTVPALTFAVGFAESNVTGFTVDLYGTCDKTGKSDIVLKSGCESDAKLGTIVLDNSDYINKLGLEDRYKNTSSDPSETVTLTFYIKTKYGSETKTSPTATVTLTTNYSEHSSQS